MPENWSTGMPENIKFAEIERLHAVARKRGRIEGILESLKAFRSILDGLKDTEDRIAVLEVIVDLASRAEKLA